LAITMAIVCVGAALVAANFAGKTSLSKLPASLSEASSVH
jgi:hypothetical protein